MQSLNADLTAHADVTGVAGVALLANEGLSSRGFALHGAGFMLSLRLKPRCCSRRMLDKDIIRPYRHGRDLAGRPRDLFVMDFAVRSEDEAREYPMLFDLVRDRVKPERDANNDRSRAQYWWRFGRTNQQLRAALHGLSRYIATVETSRFRFFTFLDAKVAPDNKLVCIASDDAFHLGVLSSMIHVMWATAAGELGVGNDPVYVKTSCFDPFPFPDPHRSYARRSLNSPSGWTGTARTPSRGTSASP